MNGLISQLTSYLSANQWSCLRNGLSTNNLFCLESKKVGEMRVKLITALSSFKVVISSESAEQVFLCKFCYCVIHSYFTNNKGFMIIKV